MCDDQGGGSQPTEYDDFFDDIDGADSEPTRKQF
jgi:hypothetical protein